MNAYAAAVRYFDTAQSLMSQDDPERSQVVVARAFASYRAGAPNAAEALEAGYHAALADADPSSAADLALLLGDHVRESVSDFHVRDSPRSVRWWDEAAILARKSGNTRVLSRVAYSRSVGMEEVGDYTAAIELVSSAIDEARRVDDREGAALLATRLGYARVCSGDPSGLARIAEATEALEQLGSRYTAWAYIDLSFGHSQLGDYATAWDAARDALPWAERFGEAVVIGDAEPRAAYYAYHAGRWDITKTITRRYLDDPGMSVPAYRMFTHWAGALVAAAEGDDTTARTCIDAVRSGGWPDGADILDAIRLDAADRPDEALAAAERAIGGLEQDDATDTPVIVAAAELIAFPTLHRRLADLAELRRTPPLETLIERALIAVADGRAAEAAEYLANAGCLPLAARAHLLAAAAADEREDHAEATRQAALARSFYESVGATLLAAQAATLERRPT